MIPGFERVDCDLCGFRDAEHVMTTRDFMRRRPEPFTISRCLQCGLLYLNPRPTAETIGEHYPMDTYWLAAASESIPQEIRDARTRVAFDYYMKSYKETFALLEKYMPPKGRILDIGCGAGFFLATFKKWGWQTKGQEINAAAADACRYQFDLDIETRSFLEFSDGSQYDLISFNGVLEHLHQPKEHLLKAVSLLKPDGYCCVSVPNWNSLARKVFGRYWYGVDAPRHLYHFTPETLFKMLGECGLEPVEHTYFAHYVSSYIWKESLIYLLSSPKEEKSADGEVPSNNSNTHFVPRNDREMASRNWKQNLLWRVMELPAFISSLMGQGDMLITLNRKSRS